MTEISPITMEMMIREILVSTDCEITIKLESYHNRSTSCLLVDIDNEKDASDTREDDNADDNRDGDDDGNKR